MRKKNSQKYQEFTKSLNELNLQFTMTELFEAYIMFMKAGLNPEEGIVWLVKLFSFFVEQRFETPEIEKVLYYFHLFCVELVSKSERLTAITIFCEIAIVWIKEKREANYVINFCHWLEKQGGLFLAIREWEKKSGLRWDVVGAEAWKPKGWELEKE